ncbi:MAG: 50S ribosomal protein L37ae [Candidatus Bathyarchaeia archaeon]|nr:50S ribosomal protein L37ae [Candidatus Bathyarchaeota archaeon]
MGKRTKKVGPARGFGPRYGVSVRKRYITIVSEMRRLHLCPQCGVKAVRRESVGIWVCRKCGFKFAGGAYTPVTKIGVVAERAAKGT